MYGRLERILQIQNISLKRLAQDTNISYNHIIKIMSGERKFTLDEALKIKNYLRLDISIEELFSEY